MRNALAHADRHRLRPRRCRSGPQAMSAGRRRGQAAGLQTRRPDGRCQGRCLGLYGVPRAAPHQNPPTRSNVSRARSSDPARWSASPQRSRRAAAAMPTCQSSPATVLSGPLRRPRTCWRSRLEPISLEVARAGSYSPRASRPSKLQRSLDGPRGESPNPRRDTCKVAEDRGNADFGCSGARSKRHPGDGSASASVVVQRRIRCPSHRRRCART